MRSVCKRRNWQKVRKSIISVPWKIRFTSWAAERGSARAVGLSDTAGMDRQLQRKHLIKRCLINDQPGLAKLLAGPRGMERAPNEASVPEKLPNNNSGRRHPHGDQHQVKGQGGVIARVEKAITDEDLIDPTELSRNTAEPFRTKDAFFDFHNNAAEEPRALCPERHDLCLSKRGGSFRWSLVTGSRKDEKPSLLTGLLARRDLVTKRLGRRRLGSDHWEEALVEAVALSRNLVTVGQAGTEPICHSPDELYATRAHAPRADLHWK